MLVKLVCLVGPASFLAVEAAGGLEIAVTLNTALLSQFIHLEGEPVLTASGLPCSGSGHRVCVCRDHTKGCV